MALVRINGIEEAKAMVGKTIGPCEWREVTQADIDDFARPVGDDQWIHVDVERAKRESPFGQTIAHGNLTLSMIDGMRLALVETTGFKLGVNYGWNKVRFPAPGARRLADPGNGRDRLDRRGRRRLVPAGDPLHGRGRGQREALLRGRQRRPGAGRGLACDGGGRAPGSVGRHHRPDLRSTFVAPGATFVDSLVQRGGHSHRPRRRGPSRPAMRYLTVSVPSMPASRWPGTEQKNV